MSGIAANRTCQYCALNLHSDKAVASMVECLFGPRPQSLLSGIEDLKRLFKQSFLGSDVPEGQY
jgi:hypothetical protein